MAGSGPCILVVDGEHAEQSPLAAMLREAGFAVVAAAPAEAEIAIVDAPHFGGAVVALPGRAGIDLVDRARRHQPDLRALI